MGKGLRLVGLFLLAISISSVQAAPKAGHEEKKGLSINGSFEGGYAYSWNAGTKDSQFFVDNMGLKLTFDISEKVRLTIDNGLSIMSAATLVTSNATLGNTFNSARYYSGARFTVNSLLYSNLGTYLDYKCGDGFWTTVGYFRTPFGMESLWNRYDMTSYYYSNQFGNAYTLGWGYDAGLKFTMKDSGPFGAELAVVDGRGATGSNNYTPAATARLWYDWKGSDWSLTPVASTYLGKWRGGPDHMGVTAGFMFKSGMLNANAEWLFTSVATTPGGAKAKNHSVYLEPGFDLGVAMLSAKAEWKNDTNTSDFDLGVGLTHSHADKYRVRLAYQHQNISGKLGTHNNDFRVLFGTKF